MGDEYRMKYELKIDNEFRVDGRDFTVFDFPRPVVKSWSTLIGKSVGSVTVEAVYQFPGDNYPTRFTLARTEFNNHSQTKELLKHYKVLVDEWNRDNRGNWIRELRRAVEYVASHHERIIRESSKKFDNATNNLDWLAEQEV